MKLFSSSRYNVLKLFHPRCSPPLDRSSCLCCQFPPFFSVQKEEKRRATRPGRNSLYPRVITWLTLMYTYSGRLTSESIALYVTNLSVIPLLFRGCHSPSNGKCGGLVVCLLNSSESSGLEHWPGYVMFLDKALSSISQSQDPSKRVNRCWKN